MYLRQYYRVCDVIHDNCCRGPAIIHLRQPMSGRFPKTNQGGGGGIRELNCGISPARRCPIFRILRYNRLAKRSAAGRTISLGALHLSGTCVRKAAPMVDSWYSKNWPRTNRRTRDDLPTAESPKSTSLNCTTFEAPLEFNAIVRCDRWYQWKLGCKMDCPPPRSRKGE